VSCIIWMTPLSYITMKWQSKIIIMEIIKKLIKEKGVKFDAEIDFHLSAI